MLDCIDCAHAMDELGPEPGMGSSEIKAFFRHHYLRLARAAFGQDEPRGRGHTLKDVVWMESKPGPVPGLPHPRRTVLAARSWIAHLVEAGIRSEAKWTEHIGGMEAEGEWVKRIRRMEADTGMRYLPDQRSLLRAFLALEQRFKALVFRLVKFQVRIGQTSLFDALGFSLDQFVDVRQTELVIEPLEISLDLTGAHKVNARQ